MESQISVVWRYGWDNVGQSRRCLLDCYPNRCCAVGMYTSPSSNIVMKIVGLLTHFRFDMMPCRRSRARSATNASRRLAGGRWTGGRCTDTSIPGSRQTWAGMARHGACWELILACGCTEPMLGWLCALFAQAAPSETVHSIKLASLPRYTCWGTCCCQSIDTEVW